MGFFIRQARSGDRHAIAPFTQGTFWWGDYVHEAFDGWLDDPQARLLVATDDSDTAIAVARGCLTALTEAWIEGIRVRPDRRREGIAAALGRDLINWARTEKADVARLAIEETNTASASLSEHVGMRPVSRWHMAFRTVEDAEPVTPGNGGRRVPARERLRPAHSSEAEPAFVSWRSGALVRASRGLFMVDWQWRTLRINDLRTAGKHGMLSVSRSGWALAGPKSDRLEVGWIETGPEDAADLARALVDLAIEAEASRLEAVFPSLPWLMTAFEDAGYDIHPLVVYELPL